MEEHPKVAQKSPVTTPASLRAQVSIMYCHFCAQRVGSGSLLLMGCGHLFHKVCYDTTQRYMAKCILCSPDLKAFPSKYGAGTPERNREFLEQEQAHYNHEFTQYFLEHPLDFGVDVAVHKALVRRSTYSSGGGGGGEPFLQANDVAKTLMMTETLEKERMQALPEIYDRLQGIILHDSMTAEGGDPNVFAQLGVESVIDMSAGPAGGAFVPFGAQPAVVTPQTVVRKRGGIIGRLVRNALDMDEDQEGEAATVINSSATVLLSKMNTGMVAITEGTMRELISKRVPSEMLYARRIVPFSLLRDGVTLSLLLTNGYNMDDLITMRFTWEHMLMAGLTPSLWRLYKHTNLPVSAFCYYLGIGLLDVMERMCARSMSQFVVCGFTPDETQTLLDNSKRVSMLSSPDMPAAQDPVPNLTISHLLVVIYSMTREQMYAMGVQLWKLPDWHRAGLTIEHMRDYLYLDETFVTKNMLWNQAEFQQLYGTTIAEALAVQARPERPVGPPVPLHNAPIPARAAIPESMVTPVIAKALPPATAPAARPPQPVMPRAIAPMPGLAPPPVYPSAAVGPPPIHRMYANPGSLPAQGPMLMRATSSSQPPIATAQPPARTVVIPAGTTLVAPLPSTPARKVTFNM